MIISSWCKYAKTIVSPKMLKNTIALVIAQRNWKAFFSLRPHIKGKDKPKLIKWEIIQTGKIESIEKNLQVSFSGYSLSITVIVCFNVTKFF